MEDIVNRFLWSDIENWSWEKVMFYCDARLQLREQVILNWPIYNTRYARQGRPLCTAHALPPEH